jgi:hypothetical protein
VTGQREVGRDGNAGRRSTLAPVISPRPWARDEAVTAAAQITVRAGMRSRRFCASSVVTLR